jgi:hypothetical protein
MMATGIVKAVELDFAEFASTLIFETLNAVISSILTQEKQVIELEQQAMLSPEGYARENLTDELVRVEIMRLFPSTNGERNKSSVDIGELYIPASNVDESPSIYKKIGYKMSPKDYNMINHINTNEKGNGSSGQKCFINEVGYNHIHAAARLALAVQHLSLLKQVIQRGIPRVYVNEGHIKSKMMLSFEEKQKNTNTQTDTSATIIGAGIRKLKVQPVSANKTEYLTLKADILSEIEITFKTVIP